MKKTTQKPFIAASIYFCRGPTTEKHKQLSLSSKGAIANVIKLFYK